MLKGPMAEWHKPYEAIHATVGSIPESALGVLIGTKPVVEVVFYSTDCS